MQADPKELEGGVANDEGCVRSFRWTAGVAWDLEIRIWVE